MNVVNWSQLNKILIFYIFINNNMKKLTKFITSESVRKWHPDKVCDNISDAILDECLKQDKHSRVAVECMITKNKLIISWEISTKWKINYKKIAKDVLKEIWYDSEKKWFNYKTADIEILITEQSKDIAMWVNTWWAWDQWIMFWYATNESKTRLPISLEIAHKISKLLDNLKLNYIYPDWKCQVTVETDNKWKFKRIDTIIISVQHKNNIKKEQIEKDIKKLVINKISKEYKIDKKTKIYINPTWKFSIWWPVWDVWLTWRKLVVDSYWWIWRIWWWAFSWKDPTKVDRSAAYMCRYIAKKIVDKWILSKCEIWLSYSIWLEQPISITLDDFWEFWKNYELKEKLIEEIKNKYDLSPNWIIKFLKLKRPIYKKTTNYWHFWKKLLSWENS